MIPSLKTTTGVATTLEEKVEILQAKFYSIVQADLSNICNTTFQDKFCQGNIIIKQEVSSEEIAALLCTRKANKAPGEDTIPNKYLCTIGKLLTKAIATIATVCWYIEYYPQRFKHTCTIAICKPDKPLYNSPGI